MEHTALIEAPPDVVWHELMQLDLRDSPVIRGLFAMRGILRRGPLTLQSIADAGFQPVRQRAPTPEVPTGEIVLGLVARPWTWRGGVIHTGEVDLDGFADPGFAVITWSYDMAPTESGSFVRTRTAVRCTDDESRRRFRRYWRLVGPFSSVIRRETLRLLRRQVERRRDSG